MNDKSKKSKNPQRPLKDKTTPTFSVLIPAYKSAKIIGATIDSILEQTYKDFELIIVDDKSPDNTVAVIKKYQRKDPRVKCYVNDKNLGYSGNLERCRKIAIGKYIYLMGNDDILSKYALEKTLGAFKMHKDVGAVTRPYYWFENNDINSAVRVVRPLDENRDRLISLNDGRRVFEKVTESVGQLSGLAYRREWMDLPIHPDIFPAHIYPFMSIFKKHKAVFLKDYILAVRILSSQTRSLSTIYEPSPTFTWVRMFKTIFPGKRYKNQRCCGINYMSQNYEGLIQIRNYARYSIFLKESWLLIKYRPKNLLAPKFWFFTLSLAVMPRGILIPMVDWYKKKVIHKKIDNIKLFKHE
jgi:glycosyltransferase involved in cell wall biosynthesis